MQMHAKNYLEPYTEFLKMYWLEYTQLIHRVCPYK